VLRCPLLLIFAASLVCSGLGQQKSGHTSWHSLSYNNRMWLSKWDLPNPGGGNNSSNALGCEYNYNTFAN
jgi:hypothetical protein